MCACSLAQSGVNDKDADHTAQSGAGNEGADQHAYHAHSHCLKGMTDADQPAYP